MHDALHRMGRAARSAGMAALARRPYLPALPRAAPARRLLRCRRQLKPPAVIARCALIAVLLVRLLVTGP